MSMDYVRTTYGVPARRGMRVMVCYSGVTGPITSACGRLSVKLDRKSVV